ncbi:unnamed protein product, partial [marine sediment metagenome]
MRSLKSSTNIMLSVISFLTLAVATSLYAQTPLTAEQIDQRLQKFKGSSFVFTSWGGAFQKAQRNAFLDPFAKKYGIKIIEDNFSSDAKIVAM